MQDETRPDGAGRPIAPPRPTASRDPRLGFRRQFVSTESMELGIRQEQEPRDPAEAMGAGLYDDPYYRPVVRNQGKGKRRALVITVVLLLIVLSVGSAVVIPAIKEDNPNGLFMKSEN